MCPKASWKTTQGRLAAQTDMPVCPREVVKHTHKLVMTVKLVYSVDEEAQFRVRCQSRGRSMQQLSQLPLRPRLRADVGQTRAFPLRRAGLLHEAFPFGERSRLSGSRPRWEARLKQTSHTQYTIAIIIYAGLRVGPPVTCMQG